MRGVKVIFSNDKYNYQTSINGSDDEINNYFIGKPFNMGRIEYDFESDTEVEVDDIQYPINVSFINNLKL